MAEAADGGNHEVVSSEDERLILVDESDREVGHLDKGACHDGDGVLHRAFSLFIFNPSGDLLLQRRGAEKRLWPLYWSNTCCSHPRRGESMEVATARRLAQELGMTSELRYLFTFKYQAPYLDLGSEKEVCSVFVGLCAGPPRPNRHEIAAVRWISAADLDQEIETRPEIFTPWFMLEWPRVKTAFHENLRLQGGE